MSWLASKFPFCCHDFSKDKKTTCDSARVNLFVFLEFINMKTLALMRIDGVASAFEQV